MANKDNQLDLNQETENVNPVLTDLEAVDETMDEAFSNRITLVDEETQQEHNFLVAYDFPFENEAYYVLVSEDEKEDDNEEEPMVLLARFVTMEDGSSGFVTLEDDEFDRVVEEYERLCDLIEDDEAEFEYISSEEHHCCCGGEHHHHGEEHQCGCEEEEEDDHCCCGAEHHHELDVHPCTCEE